MPRFALRLAVLAPPLFTATWLVLGLVHDGYDHRRETISALAAYDAPGWQVMAAALLLLAAGQGACALLVGRWTAARAPTMALLVAAAGTALAGAARTVCGRDDAQWCTTHGQHLRSVTWHALGAGTSFVALHLACLVVAGHALRRHSDPRIAAVSLAAFAVAVPHFAWFLAAGRGPWHGYAEKAFVTVLVLWTAWLASQLAATTGRRSTASSG